MEIEIRRLRKLIQQLVIICLQLATVSKDTKRARGYTIELFELMQNEEIKDIMACH